MAEHILQALQRHLVGIGLESLQDLSPHPLGGGIRRDLLRVLGFQLLQLPVEHVVFIIAHSRCVQHIVAIAVFIQDTAQLLYSLTVIHGSSSASVQDIILQILFIRLG